MKKTLVLFVALLLVLVTVGCFEIDEIKSIQFVNEPEAVYQVNEEVHAADFQVKIETTSTSYTYDLTADQVVVQGLDGDQLDTREPGNKTIKVTYKTVSVTFTYEVLGFITGWQQDVANSQDLVETALNEYTINNATDLAVFAKMVNGGNTFAEKTVKLAADVDLLNKPWTPIGTEPTYNSVFHPFSGTFDGQGHTISNLYVVTTASHDNCNAGLFGLIDGATLSNVNLDKVNINITSTFIEENSKNYGALVGRQRGAAASITAVVVTNATVRGNGRVGGILGMNNTAVTITNCTVTANLSAYNCVFLAGADGEGDKVGGIVGQIQGASTISNNTVNVILNGTRDVGGIVGYAIGSTLENNVVLVTTTIEVTATGGYIQTKGTCNAGGVVGTIAAGTFTFTSNDVRTTNIIAESVNDSSHGTLFGGIRWDSKSYTVTINTSSPYSIPSRAETTWDSFKTLEASIVGAFE